jgi:hypothetical protein
MENINPASSFSSDGDFQSGGPDIWVDPDKLRRFAKVLQDQAAGLNRRITDLQAMSGLTGDSSHMGNFPEAQMLAKANDAALATFNELIAQLRDAVDFADSVANVTGNNFDGIDQEAQQGFDKVSAQLSDVATFRSNK